jgi:DNA polymerase-3 subunit gamma/tau
VSESAASTGDESQPGEAFQALYRRFRPQTFAELRGQEHVALALRNAVRQGRVAHAYLFSGPRGTGKTSSARILAKALNCASPLDGEPCGRCDSCRSIAAGSSFDVHELDAASSNGVDAMRELVGRAALATPGRWKVYIVDEVHMLSTAASNALLKTLEEPPAHVVFVLATTEPQKVLPTIRSRTQHYEFHLLGDDVIDGLLSDVATRAGLELPPGAIDLVTRRAKGSARDALSALDQVAAAGVLDDDSEALGGIVAAIAAQEPGAALAALDAAVRAGRDAEQIAVELVERLREGFLLLVAPVRGGGTGRAEAREEAEAVGLARSVRTMELLGAALVAMRDAPEPRITLELALIRASHPQADDSPAAVLERLEQLERRVATLASGSPAGAPTGSSGSPRSGSGSGGTVPPVGSSRSAVAPAPPAAVPGASSDPSPSAASPSTGGRPALGSFRRRAPEHGEAPGDGGGQGAQPAPPAPPAQPAQPAGSGEAAPGHDTAPAAPAGGTHTSVPEGPSRDDLVEAWGDRVLPGLAPKLKAYFAAGRFVSARPGSDGVTVAVFAVPNAAHVSKADPMRAEVERALSGHFGHPVRLQLEPEPEPDPALAGASPGWSRAGASPSPAATEATGDADDFDDLPDEEATAAAPGKLPASGLAWAEGRLLEAFPGAEEV